MTVRKPLKRIAIIGLGLMGASLGLAIKHKKLARSVAGYARRARTRQQALAAGIVDQVFTKPAAAVQGAELVIFCVPVGAMRQLVQASLPGLAERAVLTDVGSSKKQIMQQMPPLVAAAGAHFIGSHPICGSEQQGLASALADLYVKALVVVTPAPRTDAGALKLVKDFWSALEARVAILNAHQHDRLLSRTSHLPHLVSALLAFTVGRERPRHSGQFCGPGFRDVSRLAEGAPDLWLDIIASNRPEVLRELQALQGGLERLLRLVAKPDAAALRRFLVESRRRRRQLLRGLP